MKKRLIATVFAMVILIMSACSGGANTGTQNSSRSTPGTIEKMMALIPASVIQDKYVNIYVADYAQFRRETGIALLSDSKVDLFSPNVVEKVVIPRGGFISGLDQFAMVGPIKPENVGFGLSEADGHIWVNGGFTTFQILSGNFDPQATKDVFTKQNGWPELAKRNYSSEVYKGVTIYSWGADDKTIGQYLGERLGPPHIDNAGRARPLAVTENNVFFSNNMSNLKSMVNLLSDKTPSLANLPEYAGIAETLTQLGVYTASISSGSADGLQGTSANSTEPLLREYLASAVGTGVDDKGRYSVLVLAQKSPALADDNVSILQARMAKANPTGSSSGTAYRIYSAGSVVVAKFYAENANPLAVNPMWRALTSDLKHE